MTYLTFCDSILNLIDLDLTVALNLEQTATSGRVHRSNGIVAIRLQLRNIDCADTMSLNGIDVNNEAILLQSVDEPA